MYRKYSCALLVFAAVIISFSVECSANLGIQGLSFGALIGSAAYNNSLGAQLSYGGQIHYQFIPNLGMGATFTYARISSSYGGIASAVMNSMHFDGDIQFHFPEPFNGLWLGARLGYWSLNSSFSVTGSTTLVGGTYTTSASQSGFEWGPAIGYDFSITKNILIGIDLSYLSVVLLENVFTANQLLGTAKFHF